MAKNFFELDFRTFAFSYDIALAVFFVVGKLDVIVIDEIGRHRGR